jgi:hypothetical protein
MRAHLEAPQQHSAAHTPIEAAVAHGAGRGASDIRRSNGWTASNLRVWQRVSTSATLQAGTARAVRSRGGWEILPVDAVYGVGVKFKLEESMFV